ncbi:MAG: PEP-CTERM sorting domain-containing protein [Planctomycetota bacterium]|nr:PEP-CTERM sorting domain-containing protein [Planctomycetaceae bacterium]MDQ3329691.1 PEP-CTERM sorting domain-containing protein [Planctomycetota bacterium]
MLTTFAGRDCSAAITWNLTYTDAAGVGFNDATQGAARRSTLTAVTSYINTVIDANGIIDLEIDSFNNPGSGTLASAGPFVTTAAGFSNGLVFSHATTGVDLAPSLPDGTATFNFGQNFSTGLGAPAANQFDLFSIALHEFSHALGFLSLVTPTGVSAISGTDPGSYSVFDSFLIRGTTGMSLFAAGGDFVGTMADLISNDVFFNGPNARAANGGNPVQVYAPNPFNGGSSISHIVLTDAVMQFSIAPGVARREFSAQELGIFADIGYSVIQPAAVPEPSSYLLLTLVGLSYGAMRRRRRTTPSDSASAA